MDDTVATQTPEPPRVPRPIALAAKALAVFGGVAALAVAALVVVSVLRRWLFSQPIPGDFELAQIGTAVAVFAFLPYCQMVRGNIVVDTFTTGLSPRMRKHFDGLWDMVYGAAMAFVAVCLTRGTLDTFASNEVSMVLRIPVWPGVAFGALTCTFLAIVSLATALSLLRGKA